MQEVRRLRRERGWTQTQLAFHSGLAPSVISQIENDKRNPSASTLRKLARALDVEVADLFPKDQRPLWHEDGPSLEDRPSLEELHAQAGLETVWLIKPKDEWLSAWSLDLAPEEAMRIVHELHKEFSSLKPLMDQQEKGLPLSRKGFSGRYKQAWRRFFDGIQAAHACGVAHGLITPGENLDDLEVKLEELLTAVR
jgi:transcriptional regulator with XRE-family HTH domain